MKDAWLKFEKWLSQNWPEGLSQLNPPATDEQIAELEKRLETKLPSDFVECLKIHNGKRNEQSQFSPFFDGMQFLSSEEIYSEWAVWKELFDFGDFAGDASEPQSGIKNDWWNPKWIPFTDNGCGDHLCLDLDPSPSGMNGQVITMWHDMNARELISSSFNEYFKTYVEKVLNGEIIFSEEWNGLINAEDA